MSRLGSYPVLECGVHHFHCSVFASSPICFGGEVVYASSISGGGGGLCSSRVCS